MRKIWITVIASLAVHGAPALLLTRFPGAIAPPSPSSPALADPVDRWSGTTAELGGGKVYDVSVDPPGGAPQAKAPEAPAAPPEPAPVAPPPPGTPPPAKDPAPIAPAPTHEAPKPDAPRSDAPKPDAPKPDAPKPKPRKPRDPAPAVSASASTDPDEAPPRKPGGKKPAPSASADAPENGGGSAGGGSFGAEGPGSVRDLGRAFTRAIPPACQGDLAWSKLAPGDAGTIEITINIDENGHIKPWTPPESDAPKQLVALVKRTLVMLEAGTFGIHPGAVSAGAEVLRIRATLSDVDATETGGAAGLSFTYDHGKGKAAFTQPGGRHVEVSVQLVKATEGG